MKYMLMMQAPASIFKTYYTWPLEALKAHTDFMHQFTGELSAAGELVATHGLTGPEKARLVHASSTGAPLVTDGPFPEAKEFLAGFWIISVDSAERAYAVAARASAAPGPGGAPLNIPIEVREVMEGAPVDV